MIPVLLMFRETPRVKFILKGGALKYSEKNLSKIKVRKNFHLDGVTHGRIQKHERKFSLVDCHEADGARRKKKKSKSQFKKEQRTKKQSPKTPVRPKPRQYTETQKQQRANAIQQFKNAYRNDVHSPALPTQEERLQRQLRRETRRQYMEANDLHYRDEFVKMRRNNRNALPELSTAMSRQSNEKKSKKVIDPREIDFDQPDDYFE